MTRRTAQIAYTAAAITAAVAALVTVWLTCHYGARTPAALPGLGLLLAAAETTRRTADTAFQEEE